MDARAQRRAHRFGATVDVLCGRAGEAGDARPSSCVCAIADTASKSPSEVDRKAGLDDIDAHLIEEIGDLAAFPRRSSRRRAIVRRRASVVSKMTTACEFCGFGSVEAGMNLSTWRLSGLSARQ